MIESSDHCKIAILGARSGRNALDFMSRLMPSKHCEIVCIFANKPYAIFQEKIKKLPLPYLVLNHEDFESRDDYEAILIDFLEKNSVNVVVSCSFSRILSKRFLKKYPMTINSHPSLLPAFKGRTPDGLKPIDAALDYGTKVIGATIHFIDEHVDNGPIVMQGIMPVKPSMSREEIMSCVLNFEVQMKVQAILWLAQGRLQIQNRSVLVQDAIPYSIRLVDKELIQMFIPGFDS